MDDINHLNVVGEVTPQELVKQCRAGFDMLAKALPKKRSLADQTAARELMAEAARRAAEAIQQERLRIEEVNMALEVKLVAIARLRQEKPSYFS